MKPNQQTKKRPSEINIIDEQLNIKLGLDMFYCFKDFHHSPHGAGNLDTCNKTAKMVVEAGVKLSAIKNLIWRILSKRT